MNTPQLSPPACIAMGLSLAAHLVLGGFGWGAVKPDPSTRKPGIVMPPFAFQVRLLASESVAGDPTLAAAPVDKPSQVPATHGPTEAMPPAARDAASSSPVIVEAALAPSASTAAPAARPAQLPAASPPGVSAALAGPDSASSIAVPAKAPPEKPDAVKLLTPPPVPMERIGALKAPSAPESGLLDATYYPTSRLSVRPSPATDPILRLPPKWLEAFGRTILTIYINADGSVQQVVLRSTTLPPELHQPVIDAFRVLTFAPGEIDGRRVPSFMSIEANVSMLLSRR
ncbi:MAG: hypothetical protein ACRYGK_07240 [Janthinobacterium lividum]